MKRFHIPFHVSWNCFLPSSRAWPSSAPMLTPPPAVALASPPHRPQLQGLQPAGSERSFFLGRPSTPSSGQPSALFQHSLPCLTLSKLSSDSSLAFSSCPGPDHSHLSYQIWKKEDIWGIQTRVKYHSKSSQMREPVLMGGTPEERVSLQGALTIGFPVRSMVWNCTSQPTCAEEPVLDF